MQIFDTIKEMQEWSLQQKAAGKKLGLVPTMGYLHQGHLALVGAARRGCDVVVVSIFVNPLQFGAGEDLDQYPRNIEGDCRLLEEEKVDAVFAPPAGEMYPRGYGTFVEVQGTIVEKLCGSSRPGHFRGVTTVVSKLFHACCPDVAYFGQKDAQQAMIIEKMVKELNFPLRIERVPTVREADGLAMSSRNVYLTAKQRERAVVLNQCLQEARERIAAGQRDVKVIRSGIVERIENCPGAEVDYVEVVSGYDLSDLEIISERVLIALAVRFGKTRLIDNVLVEV